MIELLAPGGNLEKLKMAIIYGADAVYIGGEAFGLRAAAGNFSKEEMQEGIEFAHKYNKKVYVTMNIIPRNDDFLGMEEYVTSVYNMGADAVIVSDPGIFYMVKSICPDLPIHISTQANNTNYMSAKFWEDAGASRIVVARELSKEEIVQIHEKNPDLEIEAFVHGAMCISYSGRCLLSGYMTGRDSNKGDCAQACRWSYHLVEEKRPGEYIPVYENERGTFIFNSKDLCLMPYIPELIGAGVTSFKIEGRMKSAFYTASVTRAYRRAIDEYYKAPKEWKFKNEWLEEASKASHREYTDAFFNKKAGEVLAKESGEMQIYGNNSYVRGYTFAGLCTGYDEVAGFAIIEQRNKVTKGDEIEFVMPSGRELSIKVDEMYDMNGNAIDSAPHAQMTFKINVGEEVEEYSIVQMKNK